MQMSPRRRRERRWVLKEARRTLGFGGSTWRERGYSGASRLRLISDMLVVPQIASQLDSSWWHRRTLALALQIQWIPPPRRSLGVCSSPNERYAWQLGSAMPFSIQILDLRQGKTIQKRSKHETLELMCKSRSPLMHQCCMEAAQRQVHDPSQQPSQAQP